MKKIVLSPVNAPSLREKLFYLCEVAEALQDCERLLSKEQVVVEMDDATFIIRVNSKSSPAVLYNLWENCQFQKEGEKRILTDIPE